MLGARVRQKSNMRLSRLVSMARLCWYPIRGQLWSLASKSDRTVSGLIPHPSERIEDDLGTSDSAHVTAPSPHFAHAYLVPATIL